MYHYWIEPIDQFVVQNTLASVFYAWKFYIYRDTIHTQAACTTEKMGGALVGIFITLLTLGAEEYYILFFVSVAFHIVSFLFSADFSNKHELVYDNMHGEKTHLNFRYHFYLPLIWLFFRAIQKAKNLWMRNRMKNTKMNVLIGAVPTEFESLISKSIRMLEIEKQWAKLNCANFNLACKIATAHKKLCVCACDGIVFWCRNECV